MFAQHAALNNTDILAEVVDHFVPARPQEVAKLALVSHAFHIPATKALWAELPSLRPILLLLPEFYRLFHGPRTKDIYAPEYKIRLSEPVGPETWALFCDRAALVRGILDKDDLWDDKHLTADSWSHLARLSGGHGPLLTSLRSVAGWRPTATGDDLRLLASPFLQFFRVYSVRVRTRCSEDEHPECALAIQHLFFNAPGLTSFEVADSDNFFSHIAPEALVNLRTLQFYVHEAADFAPNEWYPDAASLRVLATLPALAYLRIELGRGYSYSNVEFRGFPALTEMDIIDCGDGDVTWFLARCSSPRLHRLTINVANTNVDFDWDLMLPLLSNIAQGAPHLQSLAISFRYFYDPPALSPDMMLAPTQALLTLRHLTMLSLWFNFGEFMLSDAVLVSFAEAWPELVSLSICFKSLLASEEEAPDLYHPTTVTLRSLRSFSRQCPELHFLHIPHLYVTLEDCSRDADDVPDSLPRTRHELLELVVCRATIVDVDECGMALYRVFPHLDVASSRELFLQKHSDPHIHPFSTAWLSMLDAYDGCQTPPADTDSDRASSHASSSA